MFFLIVLLLCLPEVHSDSHFLRYYYTAVSVPGSGLPEFSIAGYMDDQQTELYSSDTGRRVPVAPWMKENVGPDYWESEAQDNKLGEALGRHEMKIVMNRFNHTGGLHIGQLMHGCELRDDGSTAWFEHYNYDGREYMYLDTQTASYIPTTTEAHITTERWNSANVREGARAKNILENRCVEKLKRFLVHGREHLELRVRPGVKVTGRESGEITKLHCLVYGFHPRAVDVKWVKNRTDDVPSYESTDVLPNPDGTYQVRVTVEVIPKEGDSYSCYVDHSSLGEPLLVKWEPKQDSPLAVIISAVVIIVVLTPVIAGVIIYRNKKKHYTAANNEEVKEAEALPMT